MKVEISDSPVFVLGPPRSGTSMMQWALRQHPRLWGGQESDYLIPLMRSLRDVHEHGSRRGKLHWLSGQEVGFDEFVRHVGIGINSLYTSRSGGKRWVEQTPQYTLHLNNMVRLFPDGRFLFMVRDGRDVVHSLRNFVSPVEHRNGCQIWKDFMTAGLEFTDDDHGEQMMMVSYRAAVEETSQEMAKVFEFIDEDFEQASVEFIRSNSPINSSFSEAEGLARTKRWQTWSPDEREVFADVAGDLLVDLGFEVDDSWIKETTDA